LTTAGFFGSGFGAGLTSWIGAGAGAGAGAGLGAGAGAGFGGSCVAHAARASANDAEMSVLDFIPPPSFFALIGAAI
jgi:hypothetical protein